MVTAEAPGTPRAWLRLAMQELRAAEQAYGNRNARGGLLGAKRAAGMALRGALLLAPDPRYGRSYVQHLAGLATDDTAPEAVRLAARNLHGAAATSVEIVVLRAPKTDEKLLEAARDVMAHAYAVVVRHEAHAADPS